MAADMQLCFICYVTMMDIYKYTITCEPTEAVLAVLTLVITNSAAPGLAPGAGAAAAVAMLDRCMGS